MRLEDIEQRCLKYLMEVENPLVPIDRLIRHLDDSGGTAGLSEQELLEFLSDHELFRVVQPPGITDNPGMRTMLAESGLNTKPSVMLDTRVPTHAHVIAGIDEQLLQMSDALSTALAEARERRDEVRVKRIENYLERVATLRKRLRESVQ